MQISSNLSFRSVSVCKELFLVVQKFFTCICRILLVLCCGAVGIRSVKLRRQGRHHGRHKLTLHNGVDRASFLAEATVDALSHIDICARHIRMILWCLIYISDKPYLVVLLDPSSRASLSIVMAWAGQIASQSLQAFRSKSVVQ